MTLGGSVTIDKELLEILVCPNCRGEVEYREHENIIECLGRCRYRYPVRDDIPVMLVEEAVKPDAK